MHTWVRLQKGQTANVVEPVEEAREGRTCGTWEFSGEGSLRDWIRQRFVVQWAGLRSGDQSRKIWKRCLQGPGDYPSQTPREKCCWPSAWLLSSEIRLGSELWPHFPWATPHRWSGAAVIKEACSWETWLLETDISSGTPRWSCWIFLRLDSSETLPPNLLQLLYCFLSRNFFLTQSISIYSAPESASQRI